MFNHCQPWLTMVEHDIVTKIVSIWKTTMFIHVQSWSTMVQHHIMTTIVLIWKSIMVNYSQSWSTMDNHGQMLHYAKDYHNMKINLGQPWSNVALWQSLCQCENQLWSTMFILGFIIYILGFIYLGFIILMCYV